MINRQIQHHLFNPIQAPVSSKKAEKPVPIYRRVLASLSNTSSSANAEIKNYFSEPIIGPENDTLTYWKENSHRFPILNLMAKDYLSIMPTSVSSERAFSLAGLTITNIRANLDPNTSNQTLCLSSWQNVFKLN
jgi:hypothetical protein